MSTCPASSLIRAERPIHWVITIMKVKFTRTWRSTVLWDQSTATKILGKKTCHHHTIHPNHLGGNCSGHFPSFSSTNSLFFAHFCINEAPRCPYSHPKVLLQRTSWADPVPTCRKQGNKRVVSGWSIRFHITCQTLCVMARQGRHQKGTSYHICIRSAAAAPLAHDMCAQRSRLSLATRSFSIEKLQEHAGDPQVFFWMVQDSHKQPVSTDINGPMDTMDIHTKHLALWGSHRIAHICSMCERPTNIYQLT